MDRIKLKKYYNEPDYSYNIISVSLFKLQKSYKIFNKYYDGLIILDKNFETYFPGFFLRIYFDNSIIKQDYNNKIINEEIITYWKPLLENLKNKKYIQLIKFKCQDFMELNDVCHFGVFGTLVRLIPLFKYPNNNTKIVFILDIDLVIETFQSLKTIFEKFIQSESKFHFKTRYCYTTQIRFLEDKFFDDNNIWQGVMAGCIISKIKFPINIFIEFLDCALNQNKPNCESLNLFFQKNSEKINKKGNIQSNFSYGIDEIFTTYYLFKYIIKNKILFSYTIITDLIIPIHNMAIRNNFFKKYNINFKILFKKILGKYYDNNISVHDNYKYLDKILYKAKKNFDQGILDFETIEEYNYIGKLFLNEAKYLLNTNQFEKFGFKKKEIICLNLIKNLKPIDFELFNYDSF